jgi:predicted anti-sigma-YlaC factor YlaD
MQLPLETVAALLRACAATGDVELTCDELLAVLAAHLEGTAVDPTRDSRSELAREHLRLCASCRQESEALATLMREEREETAEPSRSE